MVDYEIHPHYQRLGGVNQNYKTSKLRWYRFKFAIRAEFMLRPDTTSTGTIKCGIVD